MTKARHWELIKLRKMNNISQKEMSEKLGIGATTYAQKENGYTDFKLDEIYIIARFFNKNIEDIFLPTNIRLSNIEEAE